MIKNKQSIRSLVAFLVTWAFAVLMVTGIVLYIVPQGRIAYWVHWSMLGLSKEQWGDIHMIFGGVFIVASVLHLYYNWKPFKNYLAQRVKGHWQVTRELVVSLLLAAVVLGMAILKVPPVSWVFDLNAAIKTAWIDSPDKAPPFGHAEEVSLAGLARRMDLDLNKGQAALQQQGIQIKHSRQTLEDVARANGLTPADIYAVFRKFPAPPAVSSTEPLTPEVVEARYAGSGLGQQTLTEVTHRVGLDVKLALERLQQQGIDATAEERLKQLAERFALTPIDLLKVILIPDYRPEE